MTSSTSPGLAVMSMLDSVRSAMGRRLQRSAFKGVFEGVHRPLPAQPVPGAQIRGGRAGSGTAHVVVDDRAIPERLDPDLHLPHDRACHPPPQALKAAVTRELEG